MMAQTTTVSEPLIFAAGEISSHQRSLWGVGFQRLIRNKLAVSGFVVMLLLTGAWLASPLIQRYDPYNDQDYNALYDGPTKAHYFGTDNLGRDNWSRVLTGIGLSLKVGVGVAVAVLVVGATVGGLAAL